VTESKPDCDGQKDGGRDLPREGRLSRHKDGSRLGFVKACETGSVNGRLGLRQGGQSAARRGPGKLRTEDCAPCLSVHAEEIERKRKSTRKSKKRGLA
jgi:hypothetical protein